MAFIAPVIGAIGGFLGSAAGATAVAAVGAGASLAAAMHRPKTPKAPPVVPLPDPAGAATKLRLAQTQQAANARSGVRSTLIGGQLGDTTNPTIAAPLVLGRV